MNVTSVSFRKQYSTERMKSRHRHVWVFPLAVLAFVTVWAFFGLRDISPGEQAQGYSSLFFQIPLLNTIVLPLTIAVISSRLCDMEIKGNTLKLLCTLQQRQVIFNCKLLHSLGYLLILCFGEGCIILLCGALFDFTEELSLTGLFITLGVVFLVGTCVMIIQQVLSLLFDNQLIPLVAGLAGSFLGLFSMYFPQAVSRFVLWGYFGAFAVTRMDWNPETRIVTYYDVPLPVGTLLGFFVFTLFVYFVGKFLFERKEL